MRHCGGCFSGENKLLQNFFFVWHNLFVKYWEQYSEQCCVQLIIQYSVQCTVQLNDLFRQSYSCK